MRPGLLSAAAVLTVLSLPAAPAWADTYAIGALRPGTLTYRTAVAIAEASNKAGELYRVQSFGGSAQVIGLVEGGEVSFGFANAMELDMAARGVEIYDGRQAKRLRAVAAVFPLRISIMVPADSPATRLADLKGMRFPSEFSAAPILRKVMAALLANGGLDMSDVEAVPVANIVRAMEEFGAGRLDAISNAVGVPKNIELASRLGGLRFLSVEDTPEAIAAMRRVLPVASVTEVAPGPGLVGVEEPTRFMTYSYVLFASADIPDQVIHDLAKRLVEGRDGMIAATGARHGFRPEEFARRQPIPFHPGAEAYYRSAGLWQGD